MRDANVSVTPLPDVSIFVATNAFVSHKHQITNNAGFKLYSIISVTTADTRKRFCEAVADPGGKVVQILLSTSDHGDPWSNFPLNNTVELPDAI